jgi:GH24 family phage-related lysozyme (muramidase)
MITKSLLGELLGRAFRIAPEIFKFYGGGKPLPGLIARREAEARLLAA